MKRIFITAAACIIIVIFASCSSGETVSDVSPSPSAASTASASAAAPTPSAVADILTSADPDPAVSPPSGYTFIYNGIPVVLGSPADDFIAEAGEPSKVFESPSCAFEGVDKLLYYASVIIYTYPIEGNDYILSVEFQDDGAETPEGAYIGMGKSEAESLYGTPSIGDDMSAVYEKDGTSLTFIYEDGKVSAITYYYNNALA